MALKPGSRLKSVVCEAEVMVVKCASDADLTCGGSVMTADGTQSPEAANADQMHGCVIGKRYVNQAESIEVLCVKSGDGSLYFDAEELMTKDTKKLPSTD